MTVRGPTSIALSILIVLSACGRTDATTDDEQMVVYVAAYIEMSEPAVTPVPVEDLVMARPGDRASPAGFLSGIRSSALAIDSSGRYGFRIQFQLAITPAERLAIEQRWAESGLGVSLLTLADSWPGCANPPECGIVADTPSLPDWS